MRLIDADELKHKIADMVSEYKERLDEDSEIDPYSDGILTALSEVFEAIDNQPTAYDIEQVVEELEELRKIDMCSIGLCPDENIACSECVNNRMVDKTIEIVKLGGVERR